ncbi:N-acetylmuramic acid 6-phosphate etherase [Rhizosaccharibacter radicis]|uniref:N-acetylmuramic acid 6-phosphate etherase n=1 Tax=Rhizosaccharibacter radicis TaxID=2782605 RepID=A0ABT1VTV6_9PROT|nr:N-acetylmuramic acid 6-phosphate etherase [Acetobacteraceae bacterium KSS12]
MPTPPHAPTRTEQHDPRYATLDGWPAAAVLDALLESQMSGVAAVRGALPALDRVVAEALPRLRRGGRLAYAGAGTSGRIAFQDGAELAPTFDWPEDRTVFLMAGGPAALVRAVEGAEDDRAAAEQAVAVERLGGNDVLLALAASGTTPFTRAAVAAAKERGCLAVGISCNPDAPLLHEADIGVLAETGPEAVAGSTRLKAGTAQKVILNLLSTTLMVGLGRVHQGLMVDMRATNAKLRERAGRMLRTLTGADAEAAARALAATGDRVKPAVLVLDGATAAEADALLATHHGSLRAALKERRGG